MEDMYHSCRWCKHYKDGCCTKDNFYLINERGWPVEEDVRLEIKEPDTHYCKDWE